MKMMNYFSEMADRQKFVKFHFQTRILLQVFTEFFQSKVYSNVYLYAQKRSVMPISVKKK